MSERGVFMRRFKPISLTLLLAASFSACERSGSHSSQNSLDQLFEQDTIPAHNEAVNMTSFDETYTDFFENFTEEKAAIIQDAEGFPLLRTKGDQRLHSTLQALADFRRIREPAFVMDKSQLTITKLQDDWIETSVEGVLSERVKQLFLKSIKDTVDANCWNTALVGAGLEEGLLHSVGVDFSYQMSSQQCQELAPNESLKTGDVIAIRARSETSGTGFVEVHAAVYITEDLWLS